ncbi:reverse transcriptase domain-containing protein [Tanacetum coccineum]|uniref:Reverse transcriptase domain-containing protein n=1 Tax=Tanacetum coccineum TaxID=301880 RepID=A0ABQ4Y671_9ASTR
MRLMLAPRSAKALHAKALHEKVLLKVQGIRKLLRSPSLGGTLFWIIVELSSLRKAMRFVQACVSLVRASFSCWKKAWISPRSRSNRAGGKNRLIKAVRSSSHASMVPLLSSSSQVFASPTNDLNDFDSDYDEAPSARAMLMGNLSSYDSDVLSEISMDDEPMWPADRVVALTLGSAITIPETANEFAIKEIWKNEVVRLMMFPLSLTKEAKTWLNELNEGTIEMWDELRTAFIIQFFRPAFFDRLQREIHAFSQHENESLTDAWLRSGEMVSGGGYC